MRNQLARMSRPPQDRPATREQPNLHHISHKVGGVFFLGVPLGELLQCPDEVVGVPGRPGVQNADHEVPSVVGLNAVPVGHGTFGR